MSTASEPSGRPTNIEGGGPIKSDQVGKPFPQGPGPVLRLTVELDDGQWSVLAKTLVERMTVPASQPAPHPGRSGRVTGLWFEVVDRKGRVLYRNVLPEPLPGVEVHHRDGSMARISAPPRPWGTDIRIPLVPKGETFRLYHVPSAQRQKGDAVAPVLDLNLDELKKG